MNHYTLTKHYSIYDPEMEAHYGLVTVELNGEVIKSVDSYKYGLTEWIDGFLAAMEATCTKVTVRSVADDEVDRP